MSMNVLPVQLFAQKIKYVKTFLEDQHVCVQTTDTETIVQRVSNTGLQDFKIVLFIFIIMSCEL